MQESENVKEFLHFQNSSLQKKYLKCLNSKYKSYLICYNFKSKQF